jgi:hypothetical protein
MKWAEKKAENDERGYLTGDANVDVKDLREIREGRGARVFVEVLLLHFDELRGGFEDYEVNLK